MEVIYKVVFKVKNNVIKSDKEIENVITKKLLRVILNLEKSKR